MSDNTTTHFQTHTEYIECLDALLHGAQRIIRIYDWDLSDGGYTQSQRIETLKEFCRLDRTRKLRILLADDTWLRTGGSAVMQLLKVWGHVLEIRLRDSEPPPAQDCFVLADRSGVLKRFDKNIAKGVYYTHSPGDAADLGLRFDSEWERAQGAVAATTLGL